MATHGRVVAPELRSDIRLNPAPIQSDTFAPPPRPVDNQNLARLSAALSSFSGSLGNLGQTLGATDARAEEQEAWNVQRQYAGWSPDQWNDAVVSGTAPKGAKTTEQMALDTMAGDGMAAHQIEVLRKELLTETDWNATDVEARVRQQMADTLGQYGSDPNFGKPYARRMEAFVGSIATMQQNRNIEQFEQGKKDGAFSHLSILYRDLSANGAMSPKQRAERLMAEGKLLGKDGVLVMDHAAVDQEYLNLASRIADTDPETAIELLDTRRTGSKGETIPALSAKRNAIDQTEAIRARAVAAIDTKAFADGVAAHTAAGVEALESGNFDLYDGDKLITLPSGEVRKLESSTLKDNVFRTFDQRSVGIAAQRRESLGDRIAREERAFTPSGIKNPTIERQLKNLSGTIDQSLIQDDTARTKALGRLEVYQHVRKNSVSRLMDYTEERDREFAEAFFIARNDMGMDDAGALEYAVSVNSVLDPRKLPSVLYMQNEIASGVRTVMNASGFDPEAANASTVHAKITTLAQHNVARGMNRQKAINKAVEVMQRSSLMHNGMVLGNVNGAGPQDFNATAERVIDAFLAGPAKGQSDAGKIDRSQIVLRPISQGDGTRFILSDKDLNPVRGDDGQLQIVTLDGMRKFEAADVKAKAEEAAKEVQRQHEAATRAKGIRVKREREIKADPGKGFLEREGIPVPDLDPDRSR